jgi:hypothetical protein
MWKKMISIYSQSAFIKLTKTIFFQILNDELFDYQMIRHYYLSIKIHEKSLIDNLNSFLN